MARNPYRIRDARAVKSDISYNDYILHYVFLDAEWSRRPSYENNPTYHHERLGDEFTTTCCRYRDRVNKNAADWSKANNPCDRPPQIAPYLFNPAWLAPFGHADGFGWVLLDDIHPFQCLTAEATTSIEEVGLALCPRASSICSSEQRSLFLDPHRLIDGTPLPSGSQDGSYHRARHSFENTYPMVVFTRFKINGLLALGQGLLAQQALFQTLASRICRTRDALRRRCQKESGLDTFFGAQSVTNVKCVLLDLLGTEEIGLLLFCDNCSVAFSLVAACRSLTIGDVLDRDPRIASLWKVKDTHRAISYVRHDIERRKGVKPCNVDTLRDNHAFTWVHSIVAVTTGLLKGESRPSCRGMIAANTKFLISPGHFGSAARHLGLDELHATAAKDCGGNRTPSKCYYYLVGKHDATVQLGDNPPAMTAPLVPTRQVLNVIRENLNRFACEKSTLYRGRSVIDFSTDISVPIPQTIPNEAEVTSWIVGNTGANHFSLSHLLSELRDRLFTKHPSKSALASGGLNLASLTEALRACGIPAQLRRTIGFLYQNYATLLADPFHFDSVLDLYDPFVALHHVLTNRLQRGKRPSINGPPDFELPTMSEIANYIDALDCALSHRVLRPFPEARVHDLAVDFRGALSQVVAAADVPVKCGLGFFRKYVFAFEDESGAREKLADARKNQIGLVTRISLLPGTACHEIQFRSFPHSVLAYLDADAAHYLYVSSYPDYLHETFHLIFGKHGCLVPCSNSSSPVTEERLTEIGVHALSLLLVFKGDVPTFVAHNVCSYASDMTSRGKDNAETIMRFSEFATRLFFAAAPYRSDGKRSPLAPCFANHLDCNVRLRHERFFHFVEEWIRFVPECRALWSEVATSQVVKNFVRRHFDGVFAGICGQLRALHKDIWRTYKQFVKGTRIGGSAETFQSVVRKDVRMGLDNGKPIARNTYKNPLFFSSRGGSVNFKRTNDETGIDPLVLLCELLYNYIKARHHRNPMKEVHLPRNQTTGEVDFHPLHPPIVGYNEWLVDRGLNCLFSCSPDARRKRVLKQIVVFKTCWDISSSLRARRLRDMLLDNWPGLATALRQDMAQGKARKLLR
jgi:hypothetical protein